MGWFMFDAPPGHEGYVVALVQVKNANGHTRFRELSYCDADDRQIGRDEIRAIQAACDCGWRSSYFYAPHGTRYSPYVATVPESYEDACHELWSAHIAAAASLPKPLGCVQPYDD